MLGEATLKRPAVLLAAGLALTAAHCPNRADPLHAYSQVVVALDAAFSAWFIAEAERARDDADIRRLERLDGEWAALMSAVRVALVAAQAGRSAVPLGEAIEVARLFLSAVGAHVP